MRREVAGDDVARAQAGGVVSRATVSRSLRELPPFDGVSGSVVPALVGFPKKSVWIVEARGGARQLASRWEPVRVPEAGCGKTR